MFLQQQTNLKMAFPFSINRVHDFVGKSKTRAYLFKYFTPNILECVLEMQMRQNKPFSFSTLYHKS